MTSQMLNFFSILFLIGQFTIYETHLVSRNGRQEVERLIKLERIDLALWLFHKIIWIGLTIKFFLQ